MQTNPSVGQPADSTFDQSFAAAGAAGARADAHETAARLGDLLASAARLYPGIWRIGEERRLAGAAGSGWPHWCFLPFSVLCESLVAHGYVEAGQRAKLSTLPALLAWRATQGIYQFDATVFDELWQTSLDSDIPGDVLYCLPEWCVYVRTFGRSFTGRPLQGFFAYLDLAATDGHPELRFVLDWGTPDLATTLPLDLTRSTLRQAIESSRDHWTAELASSAMFPGSAAEIAALARADMAEYVQAVTSLMNLVLYIGSVNAELHDPEGRSGRPRRPLPVRTRKGWRLFAPARPTAWEVGGRLGAALRRWAEEERRGGWNDGRATLRPHIRRAHWHTYWTGPRAKAPKRLRVVKWIPPLGVNVKEDETRVPAVRRVTARPGA